MRFGRHIRTSSERRGQWPAYGFTLIELLVVVAIIAILLSILLPSLERARAQARQLLGLTNLRSHGQSAFNYASDNNEYFARGIQGGGIPDYGGDVIAGAEYAIYASAMLGALGYPNDTIELWLGNSSPFDQRKLRKVLKGTYGAQFQCPDFPDDNPNDNDPLLGNPSARHAETQYNDYVASAMPVPYTERNIQHDVPGGGQSSGPDDSEFQGEPANATDYDSAAKASQIEVGGKSLSEIIYVTEAHRSLYWTEYRFHHFFLTSMLPFGARPRIANDQRHPGGINALFFDGHARTMPLRLVDPGWPRSLGLRLRWFTTVPPEYY